MLRVNLFNLINNTSLLPILIFFHFCFEGSSIYDVTPLRGEGNKDLVTSVQRLTAKSVTIEKEVLKMIIKCVTSFMNDPESHF